MAKRSELGFAIFRAVEAPELMVSGHMSIEPFSPTWRISQRELQDGPIAGLTPRAHCQRIV